jgi:hypothetical protein
MLFNENMVFFPPALLLCNNIQPPPRGIGLCWSLFRCPALAGYSRSSKRSRWRHHSFPHARQSLFPAQFSLKGPA